MSQKNWTAKPWQDDEPLECTMVIPETADCATLAFRAPSGAWFDYLPGQFLTLEVPHPSGPLLRSYTISSSPSRPNSISLTVKAQAGSLGTRWLINNLRAGMRLKAQGPAGRFSTALHPARKHLFISAGSGITPMMSMTTWAWDSGNMPDIVFVHAARAPADIIFRKRLEGFASRVPGVQLRFTVEETDPFEVWHGYRGRLNQIMLGLMAPDYLEREVFCCGPAPFMRAVREMLASLGFDMGRYHEESFTAPDAPIETPAATGAAEVHFARSKLTLTTDGSETLLALARRAGLNIASSCNFGLCGTCKITKLSGEVLMVHNGGIQDAEIRAGKILACCPARMAPSQLICDQLAARKPLRAAIFLPTERPEMTVSQRDEVIRCDAIWKVFGASAARAMSAIRDEGLEKTEIRKRFDCVVGVQNASFSVRRGEIFCIMGLSGSGKSTPIRHINRLIEPSSGAVYIEGENVNEMNPRAAPPARRADRHGVSEHGLDAALHGGTKCSALARSARRGAGAQSSAGAGGGGSHGLGAKIPRRTLGRDAAAGRPRAGDCYGPDDPSDG